MFVQSLLPYGEGAAWSAVVESLASRVVGRPGAQVFRLNAAAWAAEEGLDRSLVIDAFLAGVVEGWFDLRWEYHCPHCQGIPHFASHLGEAKSSGFCSLCNVEFRNDLDQNVEVTFTAAPRLASFGVNELDELLTAYHQSQRAGTWVRPPVFLSGLELLHRPLFHEHFGDEVLSSEESLEVKNLVFLFTDIRGSTSLYERLGDARAYNLVREHFKVLFEAIEAHRGMVVKTIGDAVMASFRLPVDALEAALAVQGAITRLKVPDTDDSVVVKMGIHSGPAIAVTMNDRFDYFGQTVNRAARIQGLARDQEIYFSESVFQDAPSRRALAARKAAVRRWRTQLKGIEGDQVVYSVK